VHIQQTISTKRQYFPNSETLLVFMVLGCVRLTRSKLNFKRNFIRQTFFECEWVFTSLYRKFVTPIFVTVKYFPVRVYDTLAGDEQYFLLRILVFITLRFHCSTN
jgi:hypothetical protein